MAVVDHFAFQVADLDKSLEFYCDSLGWPFLFRKRDDEHQEEFAYIDLEGGKLELLASLNEKEPFTQKTRPSNCPHLAIRTDSMDELVQDLSDKNVNIFKGPFEIEKMVKWLYIADPDKNIIEFVQWL